MKIIETRWFSGTYSVVGVVLVDTGFGHKAYIGSGSQGNSERGDAEKISQQGARLDGRLAAAFFPHVTHWYRG